jgi:hypothetical protein
MACEGLRKGLLHEHSRKHLCINNIIIIRSRMSKAGREAGTKGQLAATPARVNYAHGGAGGRPLPPPRRPHPPPPIHAAGPTIRGEVTRATGLGVGHRPGTTKEKSWGDGTTTPVATRRRVPLNPRTRKSVAEAPVTI